MRLSEWVAVAYFGYLTAVALIKLRREQRRRAATRSLAGCLAVPLVLALPDALWAASLRDWLPIAYLGGGYWLSGLYFVRPQLTVEAKFLAIDHWMYRAGLDAIVRRTPRVVLEALEFSYLTCFVFVPGGMIILWLAGASASADRFWTLVLASEYGSFGMLPWIQTRPPRDLEPPGAIDQRPILMRDANRFMVRRTSIGWNTFPSGHVAGSLAVALSVGEALPAAGPLLMAAALVITVSTVIGRYHYAVDAVAGAGLTLVLWTILHAV